MATSDWGEGINKPKTQQKLYKNACMHVHTHAHVKKKKGKNNPRSKTMLHSFDEKEKFHDENNNFRTRNFHSFQSEKKKKL